VEAGKQQSPGLLHLIVQVLAPKENQASIETWPDYKKFG
jgi:hypothetical protein